MKICWFLWYEQFPGRGTEMPTQQCPVGSQLLPEAWAEDAGAACVPSGAGSTIWGLHTQRPRMSILCPSLELLTRVTDAQARTAAGSPVALLATAAFCYRVTSYALGMEHRPQSCTLQARCSKKPFENVLSKPVGFPFEEKPNSCIPCLIKLLPWQLVVESTTQRIISHWN